MRSAPGGGTVLIIGGEPSGNDRLRRHRLSGASSGIGMLRDRGIRRAAQGSGGHRHGWNRGAQHAVPLQLPRHVPGRGVIVVLELRHRLDDERRWVRDGSAGDPDIEDVIPLGRRAHRPIGVLRVLVLRGQRVALGRKNSASTGIAGRRPVGIARVTNWIGARKIAGCGSARWKRTYPVVLVLFHKIAVLVVRERGRRRCTAALRVSASELELAVQALKFSFLSLNSSPFSSASPQ